MQFLLHLYILTKEEIDTLYYKYISYEIYLLVLVYDNNFLLRIVKGSFILMELRKDIVHQS